MTGAIGPVELGVVLPHEHMLLDFQKALQPPEYGTPTDLSDLTFELRNLGKIRQFPSVSKVDSTIPGLERAQIHGAIRKLIT